MSPGSRLPACGTKDWIFPLENRIFTRHNHPLMNIHQDAIPTRFVEHFRNTVGLSEGEWETLKPFLRKINLPRKYLYQEAGQVCTHLSFLSKGCTRTYTMDEDGGEHILYFSFEDWLIGDLESMLTGKPAKLYVQTLEDCELVRLAYSDMKSLEQKMPKLKEWHNDKITRSHFANLDRLTEVKTLTPEERYLKLLRIHPHIFQRIPLQYIASYLGIEPPSLSRLRKRLSGK